MSVLLKALEKREDERDEEAKAAKAAQAAQAKQAKQAAAEKVDGDEERIRVFHQAVKDKDIKKIEEHLKAVVINRNTQDIDGDTPLLSKKDDKVDGDEERITALSQAIEGKDIKKIEELLEAKVNPNVENEFGSTALQWVIVKGRTEIAELVAEVVKLLPENNRVDVDFLNSYGSTALEWAVSCRPNETRITEFVAQAEKADANAKNLGEERIIVLQWAIIKRYVEMADILRKAGAKTNKESREEKGKTFKVGDRCKRGIKEYID